MLATVDEAFQEMLESIEGAGASISLEMYIYRDDPIGVAFRDALIRACRRGVKVRVLVDSVGSLRLADSFWEPLRAAGGVCRWFNPIRWKRWSIRSHRKLLVVDWRVAFVGGFNIGTEYQGDGLTRGWHDLGLRVEGELVELLGNSFEVMFEAADFKHPLFAAFRADATNQVFGANGGELLVVGPGRGPRHFDIAFLNDMETARCIRIISGYFVPPKRFRRALARAAGRGARVELLLAGKSDVPLSQTASRHYYRYFLDRGVHIYEYQPQILHSKLFLADDTVYLGSVNLDRRSLNINYELMLRLSEPGLAREAHRVFETALAHSRQIDARRWPASRSFWERLKERLAAFFLGRIDPLLARRQYDAQG